MSARGGFTLVEVVVSSAVLAVIMALALGVTDTMTDHVAQATVQSDLRARARDASVLLQRELRGAARSTLTVSSPNPMDGAQLQRLSYRLVNGLDAAEQVALEPPLGEAAHELRFVVDPGETIDGDDDDGDGLIDEGRLVLFRGGAAVADAAVGVQGSSFELRFSPGTSTATVSAGHTHLFVSFTLQQRGRRAGVIETHTEAFNVGLRN